MKRRITTMIHKETGDKLVIVSNDNTHTITLLQDYTGSLKEVIDLYSRCDFIIKKYDILDL